MVHYRYMRTPQNIWYMKNNYLMLIISHYSFILFTLKWNDCDLHNWYHFTFPQNVEHQKKYPNSGSPETGNFPDVVCCHMQFLSRSKTVITHVDWCLLLTDAIISYPAGKDEIRSK